MSLLKNRNYLLLRTGWSISSLGSQFQSFAFSLYVLARTGSAAKFSVTLCMEMLPMILFAPLSGYFSDRLDRKRQIIACDLLSVMAVLAFFGIYEKTGRLLETEVYLCVFLLSVIQTFFGSVASCLMQAVVEPSDYTRQKSVDSTLSSLISIFAPGLAGVLFGLSGIRVILLVNAASFFVSAVLEVLLKTPSASVRPSDGSAAPFFQSMREGFHFMRENSFIRSFLLTLSFLNFILPVISIGLTVLSQKLMHLSPAVIGAEESVLSVGVLVGAVICAAFASRMERIPFTRIITADVSAVVLSFLLIGVWLLLAYRSLPLTVNIVIFVLCNFIILVVNSILSVNLSAQFQRAVPNVMMGRVGAFTNAVLTAVAPLGQIAAGFLIGGIPYFAAYFAEGGLSLVLLAICVKTARKADIIEEKEETQTEADRVEQA